MASSKHGIPVLMYHALEDTSLSTESREIGTEMYTVTQANFLQQMEYLSETGFTVLLLDELLHTTQWPHKGIVLTFDDGYSSNYSIAFRILKKFGFKAHFFLTTSWLNLPGFLTTSQIQEMAAAGMSVGSHGVTHAFFDDMSESVVSAELLQSKEVIESCVVGGVNAFSAPGGRYNPFVLTTTRKLGYRIFCTSDFNLLTQKCAEGVVSRMPVKQSTSFQTFKKMANGDRSFVQKQKGIALILDVLKKILGNRAYVALRRIVLQTGNGLRFR